MKIVRTLVLLFLLLLSGCQGSCAEQAWKEVRGAAEANWIIVQYDAMGVPMACWKLRDSAVSNEPNSDGIYWLTLDGHLVHISGHYNRIQVEGYEAWDSAYAELGITAEECETMRKLHKEGDRE